MSATIDINALRELLKEKMAGHEGLVAPRATAQGVAPHVFAPSDDLSDLALLPWYRAATLVRLLVKDHPDRKLVVLVRGCDERALI